MTAPAPQWPGYAVQFRVCRMWKIATLGTPDDDWGTQHDLETAAVQGFASVYHCGQVAGLCCSDHCRRIHEPAKVTPGLPLGLTPPGQVLE